MSLALSSLESPRTRTQGIRVFVAEDHKITLWGLQRLIDASRPFMEVVGTAASRAELLNHDAVADADVILLDLDLAGEDSSEALADLRRRCPGRVLILTGSDDKAMHREVMVKGARGVLHKSEPAESILRAIEKVYGGGAWLDSCLMGDVLGMLTGEKPAPATQPDEHARRIATLTPREREIVCAMSSHPGDKQLVVADELHMSEHTLRNHLTTIYSKLRVHGRLELHVYATAHGLCASPRQGVRA
jgi:DNA-binding NarL/FixJ family response regulator